MKTKTWSLTTRISHWLLAIGFTVAYITGENEWQMNYHYAFGALVGGILFFRILYGIIGPKYSNFEDFPMGISKQIDFIKNYFSKNQTYVGHNPLASLVMFSMMFLGIFTAFTGYLWATESAHFLGFTFTEEMVEEGHEIGANLFLILVFAHLAGIFADTIFHRKTGTLGSIFTGYKNVQAEAAKTKAEANKTQQTKTTSGWAIPTAEPKKAEVKKVEKNAQGAVIKADAKYLDGAVTINSEGKVEFTLDTDANGKSADEIYNIVYQYMSELTQGENNIKSRMALVNKDQHIIANTMDEWLVFSNSFISLDRTEFKYNLVASIKDNHLTLTLERLYYIYEEDRSTGFKAPAEEVITDKYALNKKKTNLAKIFGKFRRLTIDRKDQIFNDLTALVKQ